MLAALMMVQAVLAPLPPVVVTSLPSVLRHHAATDVAPTTVDVRITAGSELLWTGTMRVGRSGASFTRSLTEAAPERCAPSDEHVGEATRTSLSLNLSRYRADQTNVRAEWTRPAADCGGGDRGGTRTVQFSRTVDLTGGLSVQLEGDAGLSVRLTPR